MGRFNLSGWAVLHPPLMLFLILMLGAAGAFSYLQLGRAEDPNFTIKVAVVTAIWPGATAQEMQDQVADRIEKKLQELPNFNKVTTYTKPSFTAMQVEFKDFTRPSEVPQLFYQLRKKLDDIRSDLPPDMIGPNVNDEYGDVDSILYMLTADGADYAQLKRVAETMRQKLLSVNNVAKVNLYGEQDEKIFVEFSHAKLATLGISPQAIFDSLANRRDGRAARAFARHRRGRRRSGGRRHTGRIGRVQLSARRHRDGDSRFRGSSKLSRAPARQAGARHRHRDG
jgi:multidrug efflux pump subunit AcrB